MADKFTVLILSRYMKFFDSLLPLINNYCSGNGVFASDTTEAKKLLLTSAIDAVIINSPLPDESAVDFATECAEKKNLAVLMLVPKESFEAASEKLSASGILTLPKPAAGETVIQSLILLKSTAVKLKKLAENKAKPDSAHEFRTLIRAKMILISSFGMSEGQAHKYIEKRAMESRKTKISIAESIINSYGN